MAGNYVFFFLCCLLHGVPTDSRKRCALVDNSDATMYVAKVVSVFVVIRSGNSSYPTNYYAENNCLTSRREILKGNHIKLKGNYLKLVLERSVSKLSS